MIAYTQSAWTRLVGPDACKALLDWWTDHRASEKDGGVLTEAAARRHRHLKGHIVVVPVPEDEPDPAPGTFRAAYPGTEVFPAWNGRVAVHGGTS